MSYYTPIADIPLLAKQSRDAFNDHRTLDLAWRKKQLHRLHDMLFENETRWADAVRKDLNKSKSEAILLETAYISGEIAGALENLDTWTAPEAPPVPLVNKLDKNLLVREPLGSVLIIGAWNYPVQVTFAPLVGAIAAGNTAVIKPSELAENTSKLMAELVPKYLDSQAFKVVNGGINETTAVLQQRFDLICYTGGSAVAKVIMKAAAEHLTPVLLELGGKSPAYVANDANIETAARRICWGRFINAGQTCVAPDYVLCEKKIQSALVENIRKTLIEFYGTNPKESKDYARIINGNHFKRLSGLLKSGTIAIGGETDEATKYIAPTVLVDVPRDAPVMQQEIFGPILPIITVSSREDAIEFINKGEKPLASYFFSNDSKATQELIKYTSAGSTCINDCVMQVAVETLPFGGVGNSGMGAYHGKYSFDAFSHRRPVVYKASGLEVVNTTIRYPPYTDSKLSWARWLLFPVVRPNTGYHSSANGFIKILLLSLIIAALFRSYPSLRNMLGM